MSPSTDIQFEIARPTVFNGWIVCHVTFHGERHRVLASDAYPPFLSLLNFLHCIRTGNLPDHVWWDEEGRAAVFEAWAIPDQPDRVRLRVKHNIWPAEQWVDAQFDVQTLVSAFLEPLREFVSWDVPAREHLSWYLTETDIAAFEGRLPAEEQQQYNFHSRGPLPDYHSLDLDQEDDPEPAGEFPAEIPELKFKLPTHAQLLDLLQEYLKSGHQLGPVDELPPAAGPDGPRNSPPETPDLQCNLPNTVPLLDLLQEYLKSGPVDELPPAAGSDGP